MDSNTARKIAKTTAHADAAALAVPDVLDFLKSTPVADWDADVIRAHAKTLEAAGCHLRRTLAAVEAAGLID